MRFSFFLAFWNKFAYTVMRVILTRNLTACPALHNNAAHSLYKEEMFIPGLGVRQRGDLP